MKKPQVENSKLKSIVDKLWVDISDPIGDGSIADAIRHETKTGEDIGGRLHRQKGKEAINQLEKWLRSKTKPKSDSDKRVVREIIKDLKEALKEADNDN